MSFNAIRENKILAKISGFTVINQVIPYWPSYRAEVSCIGPWPLVLG